MKNEILEQALRCHALGFSIIPVGRNKVPLIHWTKYQKERATPDQIKAWVKQFPDMNIGIVTGAISGIVVIDVEKDGSIEGLPITAAVKTGGGGWHFYYKHPNRPIANSARKIAALTDVRGDGGYVVAPPSVHASGTTYEWSIPPEDGITELPDYLLEKMGAGETKKEDWRVLITKDCPEGMRNQVATTIAGGLLRATALDQWDTTALVSLKEWNRRHCKPSLSDKELLTVFNSIANTERTKRDEDENDDEKEDEPEDLPQKMVLMKLVTSNPETELFTDNYGIGHVRVEVGDHKEIMACDSDRFKQWLGHRYLEQYGTIADPRQLSTAIHSIRSIATFRGNEHKLHNRVAQVGDTVWLDLADERNRAVRITKNGWEIVDEPPILFRRHSHQSAQVEPQRGGDINDLFKFVNVTDPSLQLLLLVYLVECFVPDFPHALLYIHGQQGSAKSTLSKILRRLVDPSKTEVLHMPRDERELKLQLSKHHLIFYENVDGISNAISTVLCIGVTGGSSSERLYFTNGEEFIISFQLNIGINGINVSAVKADLLERSLLFELKPVEESQRRDESEIYKGFEALRPKILGAILDTVSKALAIHPTVTLASKPRMADFALWGIAIAEALGFTKQRFMEAYGAKVKEQSEEALVESVEATALLTFMQDKTEWTGTARELLSELDFIHVDTDGDSRGHRVNARQLPKQPQVLMRRLNELKPNLKKVGIEIATQKENGIRTITITSVEKSSDHIDQIDPDSVGGGMDDMDDADDINGDDIPF